MEADGIFHDDILVIDKAIRPRHNMVVAVVDGAFTVKRFYDQRGRVKLRAANPTYPDIVPKEGQTLEIWGVRHELHQAVPTCVIPPPSYPTPSRTGPGGG